MITGTYGIFQGGELSLDTANFRINIAAALMRAVSERLIGMGGPGRRVSVTFGALTPGFGFNRPRLSALDAPTYQLAIGLQAGAAYLIYDSEVSDDITMVETPNAGDIIFGKVSWPVGATTMADLTLDLTERTETRIVTAEDPLSAKDLYHNGMRFGDASFNQPLASMAVMSELLQGELRARAGDNFAVSLLKRTDIVTAGNQLTVKRFPLYLRDVVAGRDVFKVIDTKVDALFNFNAAAMANQRINIFVDRTTGQVDAGLAFNAATKVLVAFGDVPATATSLDDVFFVIAAELSQANAQSGASVELNRRALASGFSTPTQLVPVVGVPNGLALAENIVELAGVQARVAPQQVALPAAPNAGDRLDLIYLEVHRVVEPSPPADGSTYVVLGGVGYLVTKARLAVASGVTYDTPERMMVQAPVVGLGGGGFEADAQGHFTSPYFAVAYDGYSWAVPVGLVYRFNQAPWAANNLAGGTGRPDGKQHDQLSPDEVMNVSPVLSLKGLNHQALLHATIDAILKGRHPQQFGAALLSGSYLSKTPLHVDAIAPTPTAGARMLGTPDGVRRQWTARPRPYWLGASFPANADYVGKSVVYEDGTRTLLIQAPTAGSLTLDNDQPVVELVWLETGEAVALTGPWSVGADTRSAQATLDPLDPHFLPAGTLSASFEVLQAADSYLGAVPARAYRATLDNADIDFAAPGAERTSEAGGVVRRVSAIGPALKGDAMIQERIYAADGSDSIAIPTVVDGRVVLGAVTVDLLAGGAVGIRTFTLGPLGHVLRLAAAQTAGTQLRVALALGGRTFRYDPRHLGADEFAESALFEATTTGAKTTHHVALPQERVLKGVMGYRLDPARPLTAGVYVDGRLYQATVSGLDRNLATIELALSPAEYAALEAGQQPKWELVGGVYRLAAGTYTLTLPLLWSDPPKSFEHFAFVYDFQALPFVPLLGDETFEIAHHGRVMITNSSAANDGTEPFAPATERFPLVRGDRKGVEALAVQTIFSDALEMGHRAEVPWDGTALAIDGRFVFNAGIFDADAGFVVWMCLVRQGRNLRVFSYIVEGETLAVDTPARAFLTYPLTHVVE
jgi:hypothetical protein